MQLSKFSDYALRALLFAAAHQGRPVTIRETAETYGISQAHLKKVVLLLARRGHVRATRGHGGGFTLARPPGEIVLGALLRDTEPDFALVECFRPSGSCLIAPLCRLPGVFDRALAAFLEVLDNHTLADIALAPGSILAGAIPAAPMGAATSGARSPGAA